MIPIKAGWTETIAGKQRLQTKAMFTRPWLSCGQQWDSPFSQGGEVIMWNVWQDSQCCNYGLSAVPCSAPVPRRHCVTGQLRQPRQNHAQEPPHARSHWPLILINEGGKVQGGQLELEAATVAHRLQRDSAMGGGICAQQTEADRSVRGVSETQTPTWILIRTCSVYAHLEDRNSSNSFYNTGAFIYQTLVFTVQRMIISVKLQHSLHVGHEK